MTSLRLFLVTLFALYLSGCSWFQPDTRLEVLPQATEIIIPPQNRGCATIPSAPNPDVATQRDVAIWLPEVYAAHAECRSDLRTVVRIVDSHNDEAQRQKEENDALLEDNE